MRASPSIVPPSHDVDTYLVFNDFGRLGRAWCETDEEDTDRETVLRDLMEGQYSNPARVVSFNTVEGWSRDVSEDFAHELYRRCAERGDVPECLAEFLERYGARSSAEQLALRL